MKKPTDLCLKAARYLSDQHDGQCATYFSADGEKTVLVLGDPDIAVKMMGLLDMLLDAMDQKEVSSIETIAGTPYVVPEEPIEA